MNLPPRISSLPRFLSPSSDSPATRTLFCATLLLLLGVALLCPHSVAATIPNVVTASVDTGLLQPLANHHPAWAVAANRIAQVPDNQNFEQMTLVLNRSDAQEQAFEQLLADQQNPASPSYHKWLTPTEVGDRFGLSDSDLATITGWLTGQGLHVNFIAPNRAMIQFGGTASNIAHAFQTSLSYYTVKGKQRFSVDSEPAIPQALAPAIKAVRGLSTIPEHPLHAASSLLTASPDMTESSGNYFITPADFATIYDVPSTYNGSGVSVGIVSWSRVSTADLDAFRSKTGVSFANPTEIIPTAYHGTDPGSAYTSPPSSSSVSLGGQEEATLDVIRVGGTAPGATIKLIASQATSISDDGIGADAEYLVYTNPVPVQIMTISFGACEAGEGSSGVSFWDSIFQTGAAEGISSFVSSDDSAAAGCDTAFSSTLPGSIVANSPNYICSSQYATCVGGTEFADTASPSTYWSSSNSSVYESATRYIPEGGWNESSISSGIAGSGGGVSTIIATPSWQAGTGVPSARSGRYTPDVAFSASGHDGYFACMAAVGNTTENAGCTGTTWYFLSFSGTSAAAPGMAGVAALLDQKLGGGQGNLNPNLYALATSTPSAFHDVTVASSGVSSCSVNTPSMCNNSIYYSSTGLVQAGYLVTAGYDEVTGLGSLDVGNFLNGYSTSTVTPTVTVTPASNSITTAQSLNVTVKVTGSSSTPTGSVTVSSGSYSSSAGALSSGSATISIPAGSLASGSDTITATYIPDSSSSTTYRSAVGTAATAVTVSKSSPSVTATPNASSITSAQALSIAVTVSAGANTATATGAVAASSGSYISSPVTLSSGTASIYIPAGSLATGNDSITVAFTPDTAGATLYNAASSLSFSVAVSKSTPTVSVTTPTYISIVPGQAIAVTVSVSAGTASPSGSVVLTSGSYSSASTALSAGLATITIPAGTFSAGSPTLTATYTPDTAGATLYNTASGFESILVAKVTPTVTASASPNSITTVQPTTITVTVAGNTGNPTPSGSVAVTGGGYTSAATTLSSGLAQITIPAGSLTTGSYTLTATYTPDTTGAISFNTNTGTTSVSVGTVAPTVTASALPATFTTILPTTVTVTVADGTGNPTASGSVVLTSGSYTSSAKTLSSGSAQITIPAGSLTAGSPTITATYTPDTAGAATYKTSTGTASVTITKVAPTVLASASPSIFTTILPTTVTVTVSGGTGNPTASGSVVLTSGSYTSAAATIASGTTSIPVPAGSLTAGTPTITATYTPDTTAAATYTTGAGTTSATVSKVTPAITVTPNPSSIAVYQPLTVVVAVSGGTGATTASGSVVLTSGSYTSAATTLNSGSASITIPASSLTAATSVALATTYTPDTTGALTYNATSGSGAVTVTSLSSTSSTGSSSSSPAPVTKGTNATTLTISPQYGFTGAVALTASITSSPSGANTTYLPTFSFNPSSVTIAGTTGQPSVLTITTTAASTSSMVAPPRPGSRWIAGGGALLAFLVLFGIPARRRAWRNLIGLVALLAILLGGAAACGGGSSSGGGGNTIAGTTAGSYTVAIYGNSYQIGTVYITVQ